MQRILITVITLSWLMFGAVGQAKAELIYVLGSASTGGAVSLFIFDSATPGTIITSVPITGVAPGDGIRSIDFRPATGQLYGVSFFNQVYTINPATGAATRLFGTGISPSFDGTVTGVDFDPVADRLRAITYFGTANRLVNVDTGETIIGSPLTYAPGSPRVGGLAYTNNFAGATSTRLFGIDTGMGTAREPGRGILFVEDPANPGRIMTVGLLGLDTNGTELVGFDISGLTGIAYAVITTGGITSPNFYTINLATGAASLVGPVGTSGIIISGLTVSPALEPIQIALSRDGSGQLRATVTITNPTANPVPDVMVTLVRASTLDGSAFVDGVPAPQSFGTVNPGQSIVATVTFPGTAGVPAGFTGLVRVDLSYAGGTFSDTKQVVTP